MAYELPTASQLATKYPAFASVPPETIDAHVADAASEAVDNTWIEADYQPAVMAWAAHRMAMLGLGAVDRAAKYARQGVTGVKSGSFSISLDAERARAAANGELESTLYGQDYLRLLKRSKGGPRVLTGGVGSLPYLPIRAPYP